MSAEYRESSPLTPTEQAIRRRKRVGCLAWIVLLVLIVLFVRSCFRGDERQATEEAHFKYGSIGSDIDNGLPIALLNVLPKMFPEHLPAGTQHLGDLRSFGFIVEPGMELPIGFSIRHQGIRLAGLNCGSCHTGVVRDVATSPGKQILGMPANQLRLQEFFGFLFNCVSDPRFSVDAVLQEMRQHGHRFLPGEETLYRQVVIPQFRGQLLLRSLQIGPIFAEEHPSWGAGRVDTFNPYKYIQFSEYYRDGVPLDERIGTSDFPSLWNQGIREGMELHWDGNNASVFERNLSASFGAGATRDSVDLASIERIQKWMADLPPPRFEDYFGWKIDTEKAARGRTIYQTYCFDCHDPNGKQVGTVDDLADVKTSPYRLNSYTEELARLQLAYGQGYSWQWKHFKKTTGYANMPLDGIWARAPYLHNGSVPTMWDLLTRQEERSKEPFFRGHGVIDPERLGIQTDVEFYGPQNFPAWKFVVFDKTSQSYVPGNANQGHTGERYGTELSDEEKWDLIEFLKTL